MMFARTVALAAASSVLLLGTPATAGPSETTSVGTTGASELLMPPALTDTSATAPLPWPGLPVPVRNHPEPRSVAVEIAAAEAKVKAAAQARLKAAAKARIKAAAQAQAKAAAKVQAQAAAQAQAVTQMGHQARGEAALAALGLNPNAHGFRIRFHPGRKGVMGLAYLDTLVLDVYVRAGMSEKLLRHVIAHEYAHLLDARYNSADSRNAYLAARGISATWYPSCTCTDFGFGAGDWAEMYATWLTGPGEWRGTLTGAPTQAQLSAVSGFFRL